MIIIVGCGTLGSRVAPLLEGYRLVLVDHDRVEERNVGVQRYMHTDVGTHKATALAKHVRGARTRLAFIDPTNLDLLQEADVIVDCTDNLLTRRLLGAYCFREGIPLVHGAAAGNRGIAALFDGKPCLASLYAGKVSIDTCRSTDIDLPVAAAVAQQQARLATRARDGDGHDGVHLITENGMESVTLSRSADGRCSKELPTESHYITFCTMANCMAAKPLRKPEVSVRPSAGTQDGIAYRMMPNGEIHFFTDAEIDVLRDVTQKLV